MKPANTNDKIPCEAEDVYRAVNKMRRTIKKKTEAKKEAGASKAKKPLFPRRKKALQKQEEERVKNVIFYMNDDAVARAYYGMTGYRYFAQTLCTYVTWAESAEDDKEQIFISAYNSCIADMIYLFEKLEKRINEEKAKITTGDIYKNELFSVMQKFVNLSYELRLDKPEAFSTQEYKAALGAYCEKLKTELLDVYEREEKADDGND